MNSALKLHLGCGRRYIPGFVHVDLADFPHIDHRTQINELPMFADESAELIYCCHAFEYFDRVEAPSVLDEWKRVLTIGGVLRLAVPDFEALIEVYRQTDDLDRVLGPLFGRIGIDTPASQILYHRTVYDFRSLQRLLVGSGFSEIQRYDWRHTQHHDYDDFSQAYFPHMEKAHGMLVSLNVEARKTSHEQR